MNPSNIQIDPHTVNLNRLTEAAIRLGPSIPEKFGDAFHAAFTLDDTTGIESVYLIAQLGMLLLRGASMEGIESNALLGDNLPFEGAERDMYCALVDGLAKRIDDRTMVISTITSFATLLDELIKMLQSESQLSRAEILALFQKNEEPVYVWCSHCSAA